VARQVASDTVRWFDQQAAQLAVAEPSIRVAPLFGAHNGQREVAVDLAVAAAALEAAGDNGPEDIDLVVICSKDSGFHHLYRYARRVPILLAASFTDADCKHLLLGEVPLIQIPAGDAAQFASEARGKVTSSLSQVQLGDQQRSARFGSGHEGDEVLVDQSAAVQSGALTRMQAHLPPVREALSGCNTIAVVDPYGLFNLAVRSIGVGDLPSAESVRSTLQALGWDYPIGVLATVPDVRFINGDNEQRNLGDSQEMHDEWIARDSGVDDLGESHESDESPFTQAHQIELRSEQANEVANGLSDRHIAASASKRLAIGLLADIFFAVHTAPHAAHVLLGEDSDLIAALELLPLCGIHTYGQVVRVGLDACSDRLELGGESLSPQPFVLLSDWQLAELARVSDHALAGQNRNLLYAALNHGLEIVAAGTGPENRAQLIQLLVRFNTDSEEAPEAHRVKSLVRRAGPAGDLVASGGGEGEIPLDEERFRLAVHFDHRDRFTHPVVIYRRHGAVPTYQAFALGQEGRWITVNLDGDSDSDDRVPMGA
jgi:hypothetical protein